MTNSDNPIDSYCIFQLGETRFAVDAACIREVGLRPELANVPNSGDALAGLWHAGSEFLPVLRLPCRRPQLEVEPHVLVVKGAQAVWGLLVDRVLGVEPLKCAAWDASSSTEDWGAAAVGTATWQGQPIHILSVEGVYRLADQLLQREATSS